MKQTNSATVAKPFSWRRIASYCFQRRLQIACIILVLLPGSDVSAQAESVSFIAWDADNRPVPAISIVASDARLRVWQSSSASPELKFHPFPEAAPLAVREQSYLKITYLDRGYGRLEVQYRAANGIWRKPAKFTQLTCADTAALKDALLRCDGLDGNHPEVCIRLEAEIRTPLTIAAVTLQTEPFDDAHFRYLLEEAWRRPYKGPSGPNDNGTLRGKIMVGYQGWFRTPNDPYNRGWEHWGDIAHGTFSVDMWPDVTLYPLSALVKAGEVRTISGRPASLFSSGWPEVVDRHFSLMHRYDIDGAFVQRFVSRRLLYPLGGEPEWVLGNVRAAANREGRLWAVEYDVSGCPDAELLDDIKKDWAWLVDNFGVRQDAAYAREDKRPVVFVWGMGVPDRHITPGTANAVVDFLKNDPVYGGNYVIGGVIGSWRDLAPTWQEHIVRYDSVLAWQSSAYARDVADLKKLGVVCYPHVWPGFSWANLKHLPTGSNVAYTPREGGKSYDSLLGTAVNAGADRLFVGMFDEYDEGTAILPMSDDPPPTPTRPGVNLRFTHSDTDEHAKNMRMPSVDLAFDGTTKLHEAPATDGTFTFEGQIRPPDSAEYQIWAEGAPGDKGTFTYQDETVVWDSFPIPAKQRSKLSLLKDHSLSFQLQYHHLQGPGRLRLWWEQANRPPEPIPDSAFVDAWGRFLTNEGKPADTWLSLTAKWKNALTRRLSAAPATTLSVDP